MALTPEIRAPQSGSIVVVRQSAQELYLPQAQAITVYNIPAEAIHSTYAGVNVAYRRDSQEMQVTQSQALVVCKGRIDNPKLRAWTYTLDGHEYYVLKLGTTGKTLVLDLSTGQWSWWTNGTLGNWRASIGMNWRSSGSIPSNYGSSIVVGDDSYGVLWVLNPEKGMDDQILGEGEDTFPRVATGQMTVRGRNFVPVYSVDLSASLGQPALENNTVTLEYSDDQGNTFVTADESLTVTEGDYEQYLTWRSLGQVRAPGRLFRITDDGAFARIDSLDVNAQQE